MQSKKIVFIFLVVASTCALLFYFWGFRRQFLSAVAQRDEGTAKVKMLEGEVINLRSAKVQANATEQALAEQMRRQREQMLLLEEDVRTYRADAQALQAQAAKEKESAREKTLQLEKKLKDVSGENAALQKDLDALRRKFNLVQPIREKLVEVEAALAQVEAKKGKEDLIAIQVDSVAKDLESLNNYVLQLLQNNLSPIQEAAVAVPAQEQKQAGAGEAGDMRQETAQLRAQLSEATRERDALRRQYEDTQEMLVAQQKELNVRAEKIFALQEKLMRTENTLFETRVSAKESEKNAAVLREKYVAEELEKSGLKIALDQTRQELAQLQAKFLALLSRIGGIFKAQDPVQDVLDFDPNAKGPVGRIDVELIPQQKEGK